MSGHSKWSTIKRKKAANDQARGKLFSKLAKAISVAVKTGGGPSPDSNYKLRMAIDQAKAENMPKANIERAITSASTSGNLEEVTYEAFAPYNVLLMIDAATDNRNRTVQEIKALIERAGGSMGSPGSVAFNFEKKALFVLKKDKVEEQMLALIDIGVEDIDESGEDIHVYVEANSFAKVRDELTKLGFIVKSSGIVQKPKNLEKIVDSEKAQKLLAFLEKIEDHEDIQDVFSNFDIPDEVLEKIEK